ncbi:hypothetical protein OKW36_002789 [Paraburkholderia sp. MM5482-R1]
MKLRHSLPDVRRAEAHAQHDQRGRAEYRQKHKDRCEQQPRPGFRERRCAGSGVGHGSLDDCASASSAAGRRARRRFVRHHRGTPREAREHRDYAEKISV